MRSRCPPRSRREIAVGLSIANTMSPFMGRGTPMTVIKGGFALGLTRKASGSYSLYFASGIRLSGLATSSTGFSYKVFGRDGLEDYSSAGLLTEITVPDAVIAGKDYDGFVRIASTPDGGFHGADGLVYAEELAHSVRGDLGTVIAPEVRIVLYGRLDTLAVTNIASAGVANNSIYTGIWSSKYRHPWPNGLYNGWYASEVHIFDNPQLRGHVAAGSAKLFWDC